MVTHLNNCFFLSNGEHLLCTLQNAWKWLAKVAHIVKIPLDSEKLMAAKNDKGSFTTDNDDLGCLRSAKNDQGCSNVAEDDRRVF